MTNNQTNEKKLKKTVDDAKKAIEMAFDLVLKQTITGAGELLFEHEGDFCLGSDFDHLVTNLEELNTADFLILNPLPASISEEDAATFDFKLHRVILVFTNKHGRLRRTVISRKEPAPGSPTDTVKSS